MPWQRRSYGIFITVPIPTRQNGRRAGKDTEARCGDPVLPLGLQAVIRRKHPAERKNAGDGDSDANLDGDGIDRRNSHDGQIKTRLEAFLEMLDTGEIQETSEKEEKKIC